MAEGFSGLLSPITSVTGGIKELVEAFATAFAVEITLARPQRASS
jgi:hypothetical protein